MAEQEAAEKEAAEKLSTGEGSWIAHQFRGMQFNVETVVRYRLQKKRFALCLQSETYHVKHHSSLSELVF